MTVPSFEQKQYGNAHSAGSHFFAKSTGASVIGAGAICLFNKTMKVEKKKKNEIALAKKRKYNLEQVNKK